MPMHFVCVSLYERRTFLSVKIIDKSYPKMHRTSMVLTGSVICQRCCLQSHCRTLNTTVWI